ncbi:hypothetical protein Tco_0687890 [Tanacetum coccineum]
MDSMHSTPSMVDPHGFEGNLKKVVKTSAYSVTTHFLEVTIVLIKEFQKDVNIIAFQVIQIKNGIEHVGPGSRKSTRKSQDHKMAKFQDGKEIVLG